MVVLPRVVPQVNDLTPDSFRTDDPRLWNVTSLAGLVQGFLNRTGATTLPSLTEWTVLPDKVRPSPVSAQVWCLLDIQVASCIARSATAPTHHAKCAAMRCVVFDIV